jgi:hypothetical protein
MFKQRALKDYYVEIESPDEEQARECMLEMWGTRWAMCYTEEKFNKDMFPNGALIKIKVS